MSAGPIPVPIDPDLADLIAPFLANRRAEVGQLRALLAANDLESLRILAHRIRGVGGGYGFPQVSALGAAIEEAVEAGDLAPVPAAIDALENFLARAVPVVP